MTRENVLQYNKLCAEFLGYVNLTPDDKDFDFYEKLDGVLGKMLEPKSMKFHSDWNWIMEVVEAIEKLGFNFDSYAPIDIGKDGFYEFNIWNKITPEIEGRGSTSKEAYIDAINQFLIWHEQNK